MLVTVRLARGVRDLHMQQATPVVRLFRRHGDGARPPVVDEGAQGLFGVLPRQQGYAGQILFPFQLMQAAAQLRIGPPGAARGHEPQIDGILQAAYALAGIVAAAGIDVSIHAASIARRARQKRPRGFSVPACRWSRRRAPRPYDGAR